MAKYNIGDLVKSKAGGPKLAVDAIEDFRDEDTKYYCIWWVGNKRHRERFAEDGLEPWSD